MGFSLPAKNREKIKKENKEKKKTMMMMMKNVKKNGRRRRRIGIRMMICRKRKEGRKSASLNGVKIET